MNQAYIFAKSSEARPASQVYEVTDEEDTIAIAIIALLRDGYPMESICVVKDYDVKPIQISFG